MKKLLLIGILIFFYFDDPSAQEIFQKSIGGTGNDVAASIAQTTDGSYVLAGDTYSFGLSKSDIYIVKFNSHGILLWNKRYGISDYDHAHCITATADGGCVVGGVSGGNRNSAALTKIDASGNREWTKFYSANSRQSISSLAQTPDGGYVLGGSTSTYDNGSWGYVVKTDSAGNLQWSKLIFDRGFYPGVQKLVVTKDSGYALIANQRTTNAYYDIFLIKLKKDGSFQWAESVGGESTDIPTDLIQTFDGGYAVSGSTFDLNSGSQYSFMYVFKTDSVGNFKFAKRIKGTNSDVCRTIAQTNDKQLVISGSIPSRGGTKNNIFITKIDTTGKILWTKILADDVTSSGASDLINTADSGYAAAGSTGGYNVQDFLLTKFDTGFNICGAMPEMRDDSDFGTPVIQTVKVTNAKTNDIGEFYSVQDAAGIYTSICDVLPVNLLSFSVTKKNNSAFLKWTTAQEINTKSFEVYRSIDGINYRLITSVAAHGNSNMQSTYNFTDVQPAAKNFYKLKIIDKDNKYVFSEIRMIDLSNLLAKIFPNPAKDWLNVDINNIAGNLSLQVYSTDGKLILSKFTSVQTINNKQSIDIRSIKAGTYILQILNGGSKTNYLFVKY